MGHIVSHTVKMRTLLLLLVITLAKATTTEVHHAKEAYAPAQFVGPLPYTAIQPRQDSQGVVVQTGEWYKVDPAPRSPFFLTEQQVTIAKVLVGTLSLAFLFYLLLTYTGVKIITT